LLLDWMSEMVPSGLIDHCWAGPPVQVCSTIELPEMPAHLSLITRNAPWKVNRCSAPEVQAATFSVVPLPGAARQVPVELLRYWPTVVLGCAPPQHSPVLVLKIGAAS